MATISWDRPTNASDAEKAAAKTAAITAHAGLVQDSQLDAAGVQAGIQKAVDEALFNAGQGGTGSTAAPNEALTAMQGHTFSSTGGAQKPNIKELMDATGIDFKTASEVLYGVVGSNTDTRNWNAILSGATSGADVITNARAATGAMYGGVTPQLVDGALHLVGGNGTVLRGIDPKNTNRFQKELNTFGVGDTNWGNTLATQFDAYRTSQTEAQADFQYIINDPTATAQEKADAEVGIARSIKAVENIGFRQAEVNDFIGLGEDFFAPFAKYDIDGSQFVTGLSLAAKDAKLREEEKKKVEATQYNDTTLGVVDQTIQAQEPVAAPTYTAAPVATGNVQVASPDNVTLAPTQAPTYGSMQGTTGQTPGMIQGTFGDAVETGGTSAVPTSVTTYPDYTGITTGQLTSASQPNVGSQQVTYSNPYGQELTVTVINGQPMTYVPPGYTPKPTVTTPSILNPNAAMGVPGLPIPGMATGGSVRGYAEGGTLDSGILVIAKMNGFQGESLQDARVFMNSSEGLRRKARAVGALMNNGGYINKGFAEGGTVRGYNPGGTVEAYQDEDDVTKYRINYPVSNGVDNYASEADAQAKLDEYNTTVASNAANKEQMQGMQQSLVNQTMQPMQAPVSYLTPESADFIGATAGQVTPVAPFAEASTVQNVQQAAIQQPTATQVANFTPAYAGVQAETAGLTAAQGTVSDQAQVTAQQQTTSAVTGMSAAQGTATMVNAPAAREIQSGEIISGVADAEKAATFNEQIQAATATPSAQATVAGQLEGLMQQFEGGATPTWAAGSMRAATATLAARGLGASSMAGQAVIQATMEAAIPIAQMDAQVQAQFEGQNLSNRQARAMLSAQQRAQFLGMEFDQAFQSRVANSARIGDIANMNFTAEQNIAMENSRAANTMNLSNLSNSQAMVMAEAAALSNLDMANLNNRQQSAVQNAQNFMQMDMVNLSNDQQTTMFKSQQNIQALFTDQAAENASKQFNAASENQTNQFFSNLTGQTAQFNASQQNAMDQFNVNSVNALREFNSNIQQQRDMFNAQNGLVIAQSNAQWRQNLDTLNTSELNESNRNFAATMNGLTAGNLEQIWQRERDIMSFAFSSAESSKERGLALMLGEMTAEQMDKKIAYAEAQGRTNLFLDLFDPKSSANMAATTIWGAITGGIPGF